MRRLKTFLKFSVVVVLVAALLVLPILSVATYECVFGHRYGGGGGYKVEDFPGLMRTAYGIESDNGQRLDAYNYYREGQPIKGIVIMAHGFGGGGQAMYMPFADVFAQNGYYAFAYDATGYDLSEGDSMKGLSQGVIDLDKVITFVEGQEEFKDLPIMLFGHSWGGYCVSAVLNMHPEVTAVCELSGFNKTTDLFLADGLYMVGPLIYPMMPYITIYDKIKFKEEASLTAVDGFANTDAKIMIIHSSDDNTVPIEYGYDVFFEEYGDDPRFTFVRYSDRGHEGLLSQEHRDEFCQIVSFFDSVLSSRK